MTAVPYFKAVQPDGTDFRTGTIRYDVGATVTHPAPHRDDASGYLSVSTQATDCTGMEWPARLLEVEPLDPWAPNSMLPNKRACHELRVVRELNPLLALGPQGVHVAALIERCKTLSTDEAGQLEAAREATGEAAWYTARDAAFHSVRDTARDAAWSAVWSSVWAAVSDTVWDSALALLVRDLITPEHYQTLTGPWESVIGSAHPNDQEN